MSLESDLFTVLGGLVSNRVYPDVAPQGAARPYITYQKVGGQAWNFLESAVVGKRYARVQINVWAESRLTAAAVSRAAEDALVVSTALRCTVLGAVIDQHESDHTPPLYGTIQDFGTAY